jgi:hypothetical protein
MASRSGVPPRLRSPRPRHVDPTSIDADDYRAGLDVDGVDLGRADLFSASDGGDGRNGMATPSSNTSTMTTGAPIATATQQGGCRGRRRRRPARIARSVRVLPTCGTTSRSSSRWLIVRKQGMQPDATIARKSSLHCPLVALIIYLGIANHVLIRLIVLLISNMCLITIPMALLGIGITILMLLVLNSVV